MRRLLVALVLGGTLHLAPLWAASRPLVLQRDQYRVAAGGTATIALSADSQRFVSAAKRLSSETSEIEPTWIAVGRDRATKELFVAVPLTAPPGEYSIQVALTDDEANEAHTVVRVTVDPMPPIPLATRPPVMLLNGWRSPTLFSTCPPDKETDTFGLLGSYLYSDGAPGVLFFDNCRECPNCLIEDLGEKLRQSISLLRYTDGSPVAQVDLVAHSMGGLVARSYLSGKQRTPGSFLPPSDPKVRKVVFTGTPHFGADLAKWTFGAGNQAPAMRLGSRFLWELSQWNQASDDLREVDAIAVAGTGGEGSFGDGVVALTSASLSFGHGVTDERTRIVPYCHIELGFWQDIFVDCENRTPIAKVDSAGHLTSRIVRSFLAGTQEWKSVGRTPAQDPYLSGYAGVYFAVRDYVGNLVSSVDRVEYTTPNGTFRLNKSVDGVFYGEWLDRGVQTLRVYSQGSSFALEYGISAGGFQNLWAKYGPLVSGVQPAAGASSTLNQAPGSLISIFGANLAAYAAQATTVPLPTELAGVIVSVGNRRLPLLYAGPTQVNAYLPPDLAGLRSLTVWNSEGQASTNLMFVDAAPAVFSANGSGWGPAAAVDAVTGQVIGASNPAKPGDYVSIFTTGLGRTYRSGGFDVAAITPSLRVGSMNPIAPIFAGLAPGFLGLYQINFRIPPSVSGGPAVPVVVTSGKYGSNGVTLNVR